MLLKAQVSAYVCMVTTKFCLTPHATLAIIRARSVLVPTLHVQYVTQQHLGHS
jgi:hypothetical protein